MTPDALDFASRDEIVAIQHRKLAALAGRLATSPAWREHFAAHGRDVREVADPAAFATLPTLEKAALRALYPFPMLTVPIASVRRFCATSGTTGLPVMFGFTENDWKVTMTRQLHRIYRTVGLAPGDRVYQGYGYGLWIGGPSMDEALASYGAVNFPIGPGRGEVVVEWLRDHGYEATTMSPLWLMTLIATAKKAGIDPKRDWRLRIGLFGGQSVSAAFRDEMEAEMPAGFLAHNIYGTTESGGPVMAISCPQSHGRDEMHLVNEDTILTEIVDPVTLAPVAPGETGELVITTLDKEASPVVRWRTRDLVRLAERPHDCGCGRRGYPLVGRIVGRSDDMLKVRGTMVFPSQIEDVVAGTPGTAKEAWQVYVAKKDGSVLDSVTIAIERERGHAAAPADLAREVERRLKARLGLSCRVECRDEGSLPRYEAKAVRVLVTPSA